MGRLLLSLLVVLSYYNASAQTYENYADSVDFYTKAENWDKAEEFLKRALKAEPANPSNFLLLSNLGTVHRNQGKLAEALSDYNAALAITPNAVTILHNRASLFLEMDSTSRAFSDYTRIIGLDKKDVESRYYHGMISVEYGEFDAAKSDFESALAIDKNSLDAKRGLAILAKIQEDYETAIDLYSEIIKQENRFSNYISRAECYIELGKTQEAEADMANAQKLIPDDPNVYLLKARIAEEQYRFDDAEDYAKKAVELGADPELAQRFFKRSRK